jgi:hypothetical protein
LKKIEKKINKEESILKKNQKLLVDSKKEMMNFITMIVISV